MPTKHCRRCGETKPIEAFAKNRRKNDGRQVYCRQCQKPLQHAWYSAKPEHQLESSRSWRERNAEHVSLRERYRYRVITTPPGWADLEAIEALYRAAEEQRAGGVDCVVDHIVPVISDIVCGLHVEYNLRLVTHAANSAKGNRSWPDMP